MPILLGGLAEDGRLSVPLIGETAMAEALTMGLATGLFGAFVRPVGLRLWATGALLAAAVLDLAMVRASGGLVFALRGLAGIPEGVLLWITIGMIARTATPERWSGVFFAISTAAQFVVAALVTGYVEPRFHANGGFALVAGVMALAFPLAIASPTRFGPLPHGGEAGGAPSRLGWAALIGTVLFTAGGGAVGIYILPIAHQAGLGSNVAATALTASLAVQVLGGAVAAAAAGRVHFMAIFAAASAATLGTWAIYVSAPPAWLFIGSTVGAGFMGMLAAPFLVPLAIAADPTRRTAVQSGGAQLIGGALGPLLASRVVDAHNVQGSVYLGSALLLAGLALFAAVAALGRRAEA